MRLSSHSCTHTLADAAIIAAVTAVSAAVPADEASHAKGAAAVLAAGGRRKC